MLRGLGPDGLQRAEAWLLRSSLEVEAVTTWVTGWRLCGMLIAAGWPELYGSIRTRPGQCGPGVLPLLCPVYDCLAAVEVGSSRVAARLLSLAPKMS